MTILLGARSRRRGWWLLAFLATIAAGLASRRFPQVLPAFVGKYPGDALWALMVFFGLGAIFRTASSLQVAAGALAFSFAIETLKLYQAPWIVDLRHTLFGHLVLGQVFSWQNFAAYTVGILAGLLIEVVAVPKRKTEKAVA